MNEIKIKFPKQWRHWCQCAGIEPIGRKKYYNHYMTGRGRHWRVNCYGVFECSCPNEHFDKWANSCGAEADKMPTTKAEFLATVALLLEQSKDAK